MTRKRNYFDNALADDDIAQDETDCLERMTGCERDKEERDSEEVSNILAGGHNRGFFND